MTNGREQLAARVERAAARGDLSTVAEILADAISENRDLLTKRAEQVAADLADQRRLMWTVLMAVMALCGTILTFAAVVVFF